MVLSLTRAEHFGAADPLRVRGEALNSQAARASVFFQAAAAPPKGPLPLQAVFPNNTDPSAGRALTGGSSPIAVLPPREAKARSCA